jgi:hypothetical protein
LSSLQAGSIIVDMFSRLRTTVMVFVAMACWATGARAEEATTSSERPSPLWAGTGFALALGGMAVTYWTATELRDRNPDCSKLSGGCFWANAGGNLAAQGGGALVAFWAWRLGEAHAREDLAAGSSKDVNSYKVGGLVVGGAAALAFMGASFYASFASISCTNDVAGERQMDYGCASRKKYVPTLVQLGSSVVLLAAAPFAGYGFGYAYARDKGRGPRALLLPAPLPGGGGLTLLSRF